VQQQILLRAISKTWLPTAAFGISVAMMAYAQTIYDATGLEGQLFPYVKQGTGILVWLSGAWLFNRLLTLMFWHGFVRHALGRNPPRLIIQLGGVIIFMLALSGITRFVFGESVTAIWAASGAIGIVVGCCLAQPDLSHLVGVGDPHGTPL